jgi:hypothetical protein
VSSVPSRRALGASVRLSRWLAVLGVALLVAAPASASTETFRRAIENIVLSPLDLALAPFAAGYTVVTGLQDIDDSLGVRIAYPIPGFLWNTGVNIGASALRCASGLIELIPGIFLLPFEADLDPIYAPVDRADAFVDHETDYFYFKFGIFYTAPPSY